MSSLGFLNLSARKPIFNTISMGKIYDRLQKQLQVEEHREDAEDCIKIYNKLKEMNDGSVWSSDWQVLTTIGGWIGERPHAQMAYKPSKVGYVFLNGIRGVRTLTVEKIGETEKAVQYRVTFWIVENPGHPVCWEGKEYYFGRWLPKRVVTPIDDTHIGIPKKFLEETIELLAKGHPFREVRYNAQFKQETLQWTKPTKPEKS